MPRPHLRFCPIVHRRPVPFAADVAEPVALRAAHVHHAKRRALRLRQRLHGLQLREDPAHGCRPGGQNTRRARHVEPAPPPPPHPPTPTPLLHCSLFSCLEQCGQRREPPSGCPPWPLGKIPQTHCTHTLPPACRGLRPPRHRAEQRAPEAVGIRFPRLDACHGLLALGLGINDEVGVSLHALLEHHLAALLRQGGGWGVGGASGMLYWGQRLAMRWHAWVVPAMQEVKEWPWPLSSPEARVEQRGRGPSNAAPSPPASTRAVQGPPRGRRGARTQLGWPAARPRPAAAQPASWVAFPSGSPRPVAAGSARA